jgi:hypothetical protein
MTRTGEKLPSLREFHNLLTSLKITLAKESLIHIFKNPETFFMFYREEITVIKPKASDAI